MNRYVSVLGLAARSSLWKGLGVILASAALAGALLYRTPCGVTRVVEDNVNGMPMIYEETVTLADLPARGWIFIPLVLGFILLCGLLMTTGWGRGAKSAYTVQRLRVKEGTVSLLWTGYNFMMLLLFWAVTAAVLLGVMSLQVKNYPHPQEVGPQTLVLALYGSRLLHHLLPMGDALTWIGNLVCLAACAVGCMDVARKRWVGRTGGILLAIAMALTVLSFRIDLQSGSMLLVILIQAVVTGVGIYSWEERDEGEKTTAEAWRA